MDRVCILAENDSWEVQLLQTFSEQLGIEALVATEGHQALSLVETQQPDFLILDCNLPGDLTSAMLLTMLKQNCETRDVPIILYTWLERRELGALGEAAEGYLRKPITFEAFQSALAEAGLSEIKGGEPDL